MKLRSYFLAGLAALSAYPAYSKPVSVHPEFDVPGPIRRGPPRPFIITRPDPKTGHPRIEQTNIPIQRSGHTHSVRAEQILPDGRRLIFKGTASFDENTGAVNFKITKKIENHPTTNKQASLPPESNSNKPLVDGLLEKGAVSITQSSARKLAWNRQDAREFAALQQELAGIQSRIQDMKGKINQLDSQGQELLAQSILEAHTLLENASRSGGIPTPQDDYIVKTQDPLHRKKVEDLRNYLNTMTPKTPERIALRKAALKLAEEADTAFSRRELGMGETIYEHAWGLADVVVGFDPISGPSRTMAELVLGKNLFTGEELTTNDLLRHGVSLVIAGHAYRKEGLDALRKVASVFGPRVQILLATLSVPTATVVTILSIKGDTPHFRPPDIAPPGTNPDLVLDPKLKTIMRQAWLRDTPSHEGYLPLLVSVERVTQSALKDLNFKPEDLNAAYKKGSILEQTLSKWLRENPSASIYDRLSAEKILRDLSLSMKFQIGGQL